MEISIRVRKGVIARCTFDTDGCGAIIACGSIVSVMAAGLELPKAQKLSQQQVLTYCGGLPEGVQHCALLAVNTLHDAIGDYHKKHA